MTNMTLYNNVCVLETDNSEDIQVQYFLDNCLTVKEEVKEYIQGKVVKTKVPVELYLKPKTGETASYYFPRGIYDVLMQEDINKKTVSKFSVRDETSNNYEVTDLTLKNYREKLSGILQPESGFNLREDQVTAVFKALKLKRGLIQFPTGTGKTEIMAAIIRYLIKIYPELKVLVIEPTDILVQNTAKRFQKYLLDAVPYKTTRGNIKSSVIVSHPMALLNDLQKDSKLLQYIDMVCWDECHHIRCDTWSLLNMCVPNAEFAFAFSALALTKDHKNETLLYKYDLDEVQVLGAVSRLICEVSPRYFIDRKILSTPVIFQFKANIQDAGMKNTNWQQLKKKVLESYSRLKIGCKAVAVMHKYKRRVLILVDTKEQAYKVLQILSDYYHIGTETCIAFGMGEGYRLDEALYNARRMNPEGVNSESDYKRQLKILTTCLVPVRNITDKFDSKEYQVLIATSVADEGLDLDQLDAVMLFAAGKKDRRYIQRVGRAIRKSKTGKYGYILDLNDSGNVVLGYHSKQRLKIYRDLIEAYDDCIYRNFDVDVFEILFKHLEDIKIEGVLNARNIN